MAINVLRGLRNRVAAPTVGSDDLADDMPPAVESGEVQRGPRFACPTCGRPLALTEITCPSCGLKVLAGVPLRHGAVLIVAGVVVGLVVGIMIAVVLALAGRPAATATDVPAASGAPVAGVGGGSFDPSLVSGPVPTTAATALRLSVTIEDRLNASATTLRNQVKAKSVNAVAVATTIRSIAADAAWGSDNIDRLAGWPAAAPLRAQLDGFYQDLRKTARDALGVSIKDSAKYKSYAKRLIKILAAIPTTRVAMEQLAAANRISIPTAPAAP